MQVLHVLLRSRSAARVSAKFVYYVLHGRYYFSKKSMFVCFLACVITFKGFLSNASFLLF